MRFFLVARDRSTGDVRLVSDGTYSTRDEALGELGSSAGSQDLDTCDLFVVDLDAVTPVVLYQAPTALPLMPEPLEEPIADVWEAPGEAEGAAVEETPAVFEAPAASDDAPPIAFGVPEALEEASFPSDGTVSPEPATVSEEDSVAIVAAAVGDQDAEAFRELEPLGEPAEDTDDALDEDAGQVASPPLEGEPLLGDPVVRSAPVMEDLVALAPPEAIDETADDLADALRRAASQMEGAGIVAPPSVEEYAMGEGDAALDELEPVAAAPLADVGAWPWEASRDVPEIPVEPAPEEAALEEVAAAEPDPTEAPSLAYVPVGIEEPGLEDISLLTPAEPSVFDEPTEPEPTDVPAAEADPSPARAYEPGELDISAYTCDDCVYVETCPKNHQEGPATCGSFQWKPV